MSDMAEAVKRYVLSLGAALVAATIAIGVVGGRGDPGTVSRAVAVLIFGTVFLGVFAKDDIVAVWKYVQR